MAGIDQNTLWQLASMILGKPKAQPTTRERATFLRTDQDGTQWVRLPSSNDETPVNGRTLATAKAGDTVEWSIDDGRLSITGNETQPSVGMREVFQTASDIVQPVVARVSKVNELAALSKSVADAAQQVADAVNQHFFSDTNGVHVTEATQEDWEESHEGANVLLNATGQLFRDGLVNLLTLTTESGARALTIWDGLGNAASNVRAVFGEVITLGNAASGSVVTIDSDSMDMVHGTTEMLHFGYGDVASGSGTTTAPYYTLGTRNNIDFMEYNPNLTYKLGKLVTYDGAGYVCISAITTPEPWNSAHWRLAVGAYSIAEGNRLTASGTFASAEGYYTKSVGHYSHAEGIYSETYGRHSHAQNEGTIAVSDSQTALGSYNVADANNTYAVIVGNGASDSARSNALTVDWDGNVEYSGTLYGQTWRNGTSGTTSGGTTTLPSSGTYLLVTGHNSTPALNGIWIVRTNNNIAFRLAGGGNVTVTVSGTNVNVTTTAGTANVYYQLCGA